MAVKEDNFIKLKQQIKNNELGNLYLFYGEETFVKNTYVKLIKSFVPNDGFEDFNFIALEGKDLSFEKIEDALDSFPVMAEKKIIIIKNSGIFKSSTEDVKDFWQSHLKNIPDFVTLVFDEIEIDKRSAIFKSLSKYGMPVEFKYLKDYEIVAWVSREVQKVGKKISKENATYLVNMCDTGIQNVKNELDKLFNYCDKEVYKTDIDKVVSKPLDVVIFALTDALMSKKNDLAMSVLFRLKENKESAFNILYLLSSTFDKMLRCKLMLSEGSTYDAISRDLKLSPFIARKYIYGAKGFSEDFLIDRICKTADYDLAIKQGEIDEWTALLQFLFESIEK